MGSNAFNDFLNTRRIADEYDNYDPATKLEWNKIFQQQAQPAPAQGNLSHPVNSIELYP